MKNFFQKNQELNASFLKCQLSIRPSYSDQNPKLKPVEESGETLLNKRQNLQISKGMSYYLFRSFIFNENITLSRLRECHRDICSMINNIFKKRNFYIHILKDDIRILFKKTLNKIKFMFMSYNKFIKIEMIRFWKVKRVQIAKLFLDIQDSKFTIEEVFIKLQTIFENAFLYSSKNNYYSDTHYRFTSMLKIIYNLYFEDYLNHKYIS